MRPKNIPPEIWHLILSYLPLSDLKMVLLVCKDFYRVGTREKMWKHVILSRQKLCMFDVDDELAVIKMDRFEFKPNIDIKDYVDDTMDIDESQARNICRNVLKYCRSKEHVRELSMEEANLLHIGQDLLGDCISNLETVTFRYCKLSKEDILHIVSSISTSEHLKSINLSSMDFSHIPSKLLEEAVKSLEKFYINHTSLNVEQCMSLIDGIRSNPLLKYLGLGGQQCIKQLPRELLKDMIPLNLKILELSGTNLTPPQMETILLKISQLPTLEKLDLTRNILTEIDKDILAETLSNVEELGLMQTELSRDQVDALFRQILKKQKTKEVNLYEVNLKGVEKSLLAETVKTMETAVLFFTSITFDQISTLMVAIKKGSKLSTLYLNEDLLNRVETNLLCDALTSLEFVYLLNTGLSRETVTELVSGGKQ